MKTHIFVFVVSLVLALGSNSVRSATITWTNTAGGSWNDAANWSPNQVPGPPDTATLNINLAGSLTVPASNVLNWTGGSASSSLAVSSNAVLNWSGGDLEGALTVAQGGVLTVSNTVSFAQNNYSYAYTNTVALTNYGTVIWAGSGQNYGNSSGYGGGGMIYNAGLWQFVTDTGLGYFNYNTGSFINAGTLQKTGGTGVTTINWNFSNTGEIDTSSGSFTLNWNGSSTLHGNLTLAGTIGGALTISSNGVLNWSGGDLEGALTVAQGGVLTVSNTVSFAQNNYSYAYTNTVTLTNYGTVIWAGSGQNYGNSSGYGGGGMIYNAGLWQFVTDTGLGYFNYNTGIFINAGTLQKTGGTGMTTIGWNFSNPGILDAEAGTIGLSGNYDLSSGTLNFGINSLTNFGRINLAGAAGLTGTVSATLNNGYVPIGGNSFAVLTYGAETGIFTNTVLPFADAWQTNYAATVFTLVVLNARPMIASVPNQTVDELATLTVTNTATDLDTPPQALTFGLATAPAGMTIDSLTGVISWVPAQTQSPSTNIIRASVTDNGTPPLSATNSFTVIVREVNVAPVLPVISQTNVNELTLLTVTNTASEFNIHSAIIGYGLVNPPSGMSISASGIITWTPAQTQSPGTNTIITVVTNSNPYDLIHPQLTATNSFTVIVKEVNVAPVLPVISQTNVNELTLLTVTNTASEFNIHSAIVGYGLVNPPSGMSISASGIITWTPAQTQSPGTNTIITVVTNSNPYDLIHPQLTATNSFTVIVKEVNVAPVLPVIAPTNVNELTLLTVTNTASEFNIHSAIVGYGLVNPPIGMSISANGVITWTPSQSQSPSTNSIITVVTNSNPYDSVNPQLTATNSFTVIVKEVNVAPVLPAIFQTTVNALALLTVTNTATESNIHSTITGYGLKNPPTGMSIDANGIITWTPDQSQGPSTNSIITVVTNHNPYDVVNPSLTATNTFKVIVFAPTLAPIGNFTVNAGQTVSFTASATDNDNTRTLTFSLGPAPAGATINPASGLFNWRPPVSSAGSSNNFQASVTANSAPPFTARQSFYVRVNPLTPVTLTPISKTATQFQMQGVGPIGPDYILQASESLSSVNWANLLTNTPVASPFSMTDTNASTFTKRFYRLNLGP